jgi:hypothetical protein
MEKVKKKENEFQPLTSIEYDTMWMAVRYASGRNTIASASLPYEIIESYWERLTDGQKLQLYNDINDEIEDCEKWEKNEGISLKCDEPWYQFRALLDNTNRYLVTAKDGKKTEKITCFEYKDKFVPISEWIKNPYIFVYVAPECIIKSEKIN